MGTVLETVWKIPTPVCQSMELEGIRSPVSFETEVYRKTTLGSAAATRHHSSFAGSFSQKGVSER